MKKSKVLSLFLSASVVNSAVCSLNSVSSTTAAAAVSQQQQHHQKKKPSSFKTASISVQQHNKDDDIVRNLETETENESESEEELTEKGLFITKRDGTLQPFDPKKIHSRLRNFSTQLDQRYIDLNALADKIIQGIYPDVTSYEIDILASETAASLSTQHPDYAKLASFICMSQNHKHTPNKFSEAVLKLYNNGNGFLDKRLVDVVKKYTKEIDEKIDLQRDFNFSYFGFKTLERSYLLQTDEGTVVERPQYMLMRAALGIHCLIPTDRSNLTTKEEEEIEKKNLEAAFQTYDMMSRGYFTHASPTLYNAGTKSPQLSSCFLVQMSEDSINGIYETLGRCASISKSAGGIGLSVSCIRARGTIIKGTRGTSNGLVPMLRVFDVTSRYVDQGGGKRPGAFAVYLEPWHADVFEVLSLKKNHGKEEQRARDLFYGLWIPDLFMKRVENDENWSLMCPDQCRGLADCYGEEFEELYTKYEREGKVVRTVRARELWSSILEAQIETGTPYLLYKDSCNKKSNQKNLGTIQCSNLCTEIIQYTDKEEVAVCNLGSVCLPKFVTSSRGPYGSVHPDSKTGQKAYFDHAALHETIKILTRNLNKIIDVNKYPIEGARKSNLKHRPIGIGVSGLADAFLRLGLPFTSTEAKELNEAIFETIYHAALEASNEIAQEQGSPYETFKDSPASKGEFQFNLWGVNDEDTFSNRLARENRSRSIHNYGFNCKTAEDGGNSNNIGYDWGKLRKSVMTTGLRNSLLVAPMPTASTSQILGVNECFEPFVSNLYLRRVKAGEFIMANPHLLRDLTDRGLWTQAVRNQLMRDSGSVANIDVIPSSLKELYKTVWEIRMRDIIDMAADRGKYIDQSQSLNLFIATPTTDKLTAMHFYAWKKGLKTGMYYLRTKPAVNAIQYTVEKQQAESNNMGRESLSSIPTQGEDVCLSCQG